MKTTRRTEQINRLLSVTIAVSLWVASCPGLSWAQSTSNSAGIKVVESLRIGSVEMLSPTTPSLSIPATTVLAEGNLDHLTRSALPQAAPAPWHAAAPAAPTPIIARQAVRLAPGLNIIPAAAPIEIAASPAERAVAGAVAKVQEHKSLATSRRSLREGFKRIGNFLNRRARFMGFRKPDSEPGVPDVTLNPKPTLPTATEVRRQSWDDLRLLAAGPEQEPSVPSQRELKSPIVLPGNPRDAEGVHQAIQRLIADKPELFGDLKPENFIPTGIHKVEGQAGLETMVYANYAQAINGLPVEGTYVHFQVQISKGQSVLLGSTASFYPTLQVNTEGTLTEQEILRKAIERIGIPPQSASELHNRQRRIMHWNGKWRTAQVYFLTIPKRPWMVAVDVNDSTEPAYVWDTRTYLQDGSPLNLLPATEKDPRVEGEGVRDGPYKDGAKLDILSLGHIKGVTSEGETSYADADGVYVVPGKGDKPVQVTFRLTGRYADVKDAEGKDLEVTVTAKPGEKLRVLFNKDGASENAVGQVNGYFHTTLANRFIAALGIDVPGLNIPIRVNVNIDDDCNAYYTPGSPSLNFFKSSSRCANTSYDDVNYHEFGHFFDDSAGAYRLLGLVAHSLFSIADGGLSEGIGDKLAILIISKFLGKPMPTLGRGFLKEGSRDYVRDGRNKTKYSGSAEVHKQGEAYNGFIYKLLVNLFETKFKEISKETSKIAEVIALFRTNEDDNIHSVYQRLEAKLQEFGPEFRKAFDLAFDKAWELTAALTIPVVLAKARDIPSAVQLVVQRDTGSDGKAPHFAEIKAAAQPHGIVVKPPRKVGESADDGAGLTTLRWHLTDWAARAVQTAQAQPLAAKAAPEAIRRKDAQARDAAERHAAVYRLLQRFARLRNGVR